MGHMEFLPVFMTGGTIQAQPAFNTANGAQNAMALTDMKAGSTKYLDALKKFKQIKTQLEEIYPETKTLLNDDDKPIIRTQHNDFDAIIAFPDCFEDMGPTRDSSLKKHDQAERRHGKASQFVSDIKEFGVPLFVFHEQTGMYRAQQKRLNFGYDNPENFDALEHVFRPASLESGGSFLSFDEMDRPKIMGSIVSTAIILLGGSEEIIKKIMEEDAVKRLINKGDLDPKMITDLTNNNPKLLPPPSQKQAKNTASIIAL